MPVKKKNSPTAKSSLLAFLQHPGDQQTGMILLLGKGSTDSRCAGSAMESANVAPGEKVTKASRKKVNPYHHGRHQMN